MGVRHLLAKFLALFSSSSVASTAPRSTAEPLSETPAPITDTERLSRFVMQADHFNLTKNEIKFRAFMPARTDNEVSIMRTETLDEPEVWALGDKVADVSGRTLYARGDFLATHVRSTFVAPWRLSVRPDNEPPAHELHAVIEGWPPATEPDIRKSLAQQLRAHATPRGRPVS